MLKISQAVKFFSTRLIMLQNASQYAKIYKNWLTYEKEYLMPMNKFSEWENRAAGFSGQ
jgi:hypothetical protein